MSHLRHSFFISNRPLATGITEFATMPAGGYYVGSARGTFTPASGAGEFAVSFETVQQLASSHIEQNTASINGNILVVTGSDMNTQAIYYIMDEANNRLAVFNDLFLARHLLENLGLPVVYDAAAYGADLCFFRHVQRLRAGQQLVVNLHGSSMSTQVRQFSSLVGHASVFFDDIEQAKQAFYHHLEAAVANGLHGQGPVNIALSGGIDSGTIAYLIHHHHASLKAYTVSTDWGDEYEAAKETADFLSIPLELVHVGADEIMAGIPAVIRYFHFLQPEAIAIALVAHCLYKKLYERNPVHRTFLTGYGSDLLNAGVYSPFRQYEELHADCLRRVAATQLSNEFSNLSALQHGVRVYHPFWHRDVIASALKTPAGFKVVNGQDKYYFRQMMEGRLNGSTVWRTKLGAHQGTGLWQQLQLRNDIQQIHKEIFYHGHYDDAGQALQAAKPALQAG